MDVKSSLLVDDIQRTQYPYVTGTSVIGIKYKDGILIAADMGEVVSVYESMKLALEVMENIEETIDELHSQAEKVSTMLKDLMLIVKQNMECFQGLEKEITSIMSLEAHEKT